MKTPKIMVYGKREMALDTYAPKNALDVQIYYDAEGTKPCHRFMWHQRKPNKRSRTVVINGGQYSLVWIEGV